MKSKPLVLPCIPVKQGDFVFYLAKVKAKDLEGIADVSRRNPKKNEGYQRYFSPSRVNSVAKYFKDGNVIPVSILISFDNAKFKNGNLEIQRKARNGWIIDGQHRFYGALQSEKDLELPVIAFIDLEVEEQINQFVTINKEAKGVPSSLYIDLLRNLPHFKTPKNLAQERIADVVRILNDEENSPFYNKLVIMSAPKKGQLSLANFVRKAQSYFMPGKGFLAQFDPKTQAKILSNYFTAINQVYVEEASKDVPIFYQTLGFGAFMEIFPTIFTNVFSSSKGGFELKEVISLFKKMDQLSFDSWQEYGTGGKAESAAAKDIEAALLQVVKKGKISSATGIRV